MFDRVKFLKMALSLPILFGLMRYTINQGDYHRNEILFILASGVFLFLCINYFQKTNIVTFGSLSRKQVLQIILFLVLDLLFLCIYSSIFNVTSGASSDFAEKRINGYSISFMLGIAVFSPIEEELFIRGAIQKGAFHNSHLGLLLTSCFFAYLHDPSD